MTPESPGVPAAPEPEGREGSPRPRAPEAGPDAFAPHPEGLAGFLAALPRFTQLSAAFTKGRLPERAAQASGLHLDKPAMGVLINLRTAGRPLRVGEIAERMSVVGPHVTRHVQVLEKRGLVHRVSDPEDRRASLIDLTPAGREGVERYGASLFSWFTDVLADWPEQDRADLTRLLTRFANDVTDRIALLEEEPEG
ncbi:MarR family winged helix-turn-helix transcriptional regulator [Streptomyces sp. SPB074]|uniref:MarR family winged helix-turn-helix transcriptional regulator n=1 Tax=Streptomyces sp. (strain SPB074) TaxID=465543 RepID=UPI00017F29BF|nr:MarR family transcriptional regulator [Streptomyces sp. SPB074]EDY46398.1 MarR-family transcriptional regulator [Streptomyces sp. SPB074]